MGRAMDEQMTSVSAHSHAWNTNPMFARFAVHDGSGAEPHSHKIS